MRLSSAFFAFVGTLLAAGGYGATFLLSMRFRSLGGTDLDTGVALVEAMLGTFVGLPLVGWFAPRIGAARMTALAALCIGLGVTGFALMTQVSLLNAAPGFLVGFGWGAFSLAGPMSLAERTNDADRGFWFQRFGTIQMAGIAGIPALAGFAIHSLHWTLGGVLYVIAALCVVAALMLETFGRISPRAPTLPVQERWLRDIGTIARTRAAYPIVMVALCACVFSGLMTFQMSLVQGTGSQASTFFSIYTITVVAARWLFTQFVIRIRREVATKVLLAVMVLGIVAMFAVPYHAMFHPASAVLLGTGYGLVYPIIQTQTVNDSETMYRQAALTWFVVSYFIGTFGFPAVGGWVLVHMGKEALIALIAVCGLAALMLAIMRDRRRAESFSGA
ncbi:MFS transporter [Paraburkholderia ginsengiterrae]|uniref:MFS transporter n=1 Tax=Paraburkholderia ginsengiterrae TaxID=1462993 RepID=A0A1A9MZ04_9BURK|nr:MFS transporter [Paraburkholderia ginsengiterrae]OAJ54127.1 MFS transporter [Paraburkholderia ginsengiterrae]OAJ55289.1 MFS transporter [Paraburkholderia ginsengiterrae]